MITWVVVPCWHLALKHGNLSTVTLQCYWQLQFPTEFLGPPSWTLTRIHFHPEVYREPFGPNMGALVVNPSPATYSTPRHQHFAWHGKPRTLQNFSIYSFCRNLSYDFFYRQLMKLMSVAMGAAIFFNLSQIKMFIPDINEWSKYGEHQTECGSRLTRFWVIIRSIGNQIVKIMEYMWFAFKKSEWQDFKLRQSSGN